MAHDVLFCRQSVWLLKQGLIHGVSRYLPAIGRFLIVVTFIEDAIRIITQWDDQLHYLKDFRHSKKTLVQEKDECRY